MLMAARIWVGGDVAAFGEPVMSTNTTNAGAERQLEELGINPQVADAASELLVSVFGADKTPTRLVFGMASLPVGACVVLETIFEIGNEGSSHRSLNRKFGAMTRRAVAGSIGAPALGWSNS
jgi:hypothetical protein